MNEEPKDCKGQVIYIGDSVVFNLAGSLSSGEVIRIYHKKLKDWNKHWPPYLWWTITIKTHNGNISKVDNTDAIWILE